MLENVKNLVSHNKGHTFAVIRETLEKELGYHIAYKEMCIRDSPGSPPDMLEQVFEPFFRLDEARSPHTGGSGLGPVSYTHLDVYKRQVSFCDIFTEPVFPRCPFSLSALLGEKGPSMTRSKEGGR